MERKKNATRCKMLRKLRNNMMISNRLRLQTINLFFHGGIINENKMTFFFLSLDSFTD